MKRILFACAIALFSLPVSAQQFKKLSKKDTAEINLKAAKAIADLATCLNSLADLQNSETEKAGIIDHYFGEGKIFVSKKVQVEDDLDPNIHTSGEPEVELDAYLNRIQYVYKQNKDYSIKMEVKNISPIMPGDFNRLYVFYTELFSGNNTDKDKASIPYTTNRRIAEFFIYKEQGLWSAYINRLFFDNGSIPVVDPNQKYATITDIEPEAELTQLKEEGYYKDLLERGTLALQASNYSDAYIYLKEATFSKDSRTFAQNKIIELKNKMKSSGIYETDSFLHKTIYNKAEKLTLKHRYEEARKCYEYALNLKLIDKTIPKKILVLDARITKQQYLESVYNKGLYEEALAGYQEAMSEEKDNVYLILGRARCNARLFYDSRAEADFERAIAVDKSNTLIYKYMGEYNKYKRRPDYDKAYFAYASYISNAESKISPDLPAIYSEMALCKGLSAFLKNSFAEAIDSFSNAIVFNPQNAEAYMYRAISYYKQNNYQEAISNIEKSNEIREKYVEGHYWMGKIKLSNPSNKRDHTDEAIEELKIALSINDNYLPANFDLGELLQRKGQWAEAIPYFTKCLAIDTNYVQANWKRGLSLYHIEKYPEAYQDYRRFVQRDLVNLNFFVDYGNIYLQLSQPDSALLWYSKSPNNIESIFGMALATYLKAPGDPQKKYLELLERAFIRGINPDVVNANAIIKRLKSDDKDYKELLKKYKSYK